RDGVVAAARGGVLEGHRRGQPVVEAVERVAEQEGPVPAGSQRRAEIHAAERAVAMDAKDVRQPVVAELERAGRGVPVDRHDQPGSGIGSSDHVQRYVPAPMRYSGSVSGPQLAVPRPRCATSTWTIVSDRGWSSTSWVAVARSAARKCVADTWPGRASASRSPRAFSSSRSRQRTAAWPPFSCGRMYATYCPSTVECQVPTAPPRFRSG